MASRSISDLDKWLFSNLKNNEEISDDLAAEYIARKALLAKSTAEKEGALGYLEKYFASRAPRKTVDQNFLKNVINSTISSSKRISDERSNISSKNKYSKRYYDDYKDYRYSERKYDDYDRNRRYDDYDRYRRYDDYDRYSDNRKYDDYDRYKEYRRYDDYDRKAYERYKDYKRERTRDYYYDDNNRKKQKNNDDYYESEKNDKPLTSENSESSDIKKETDVGTVNNYENQNLDDQKVNTKDSNQNNDSTNPPKKRVKIGRGSTRSRVLDIIFNIEGEDDEIILSDKELKKLKKKEKKRRKKEKKKLKKLKKLEMEMAKETTENISNTHESADKQEIL